MKLSLSKRSMEKENVAMEVFLDEKTPQKLLQYCRTNNFDLATGFVRVAERGMKFFRTVEYKEMKEDYFRLKKQGEVYAKDNKEMRHLIEENKRFQHILNTAVSEAKEEKK
jgi:hypothetical protein